MQSPEDYMIILIVVSILNWNTWLQLEFTKTNYFSIFVQKWMFSKQLSRISYVLDKEIVVFFVSCII